MALVTVVILTQCLTLARGSPEVAHEVHVAPSKEDHLSDHWVVELHAPAAEDDAIAIARQFGFEHRGRLRHDGTGSGNAGSRFHMVQKQASTPRQLRRKRSAKKTKLLKDHPKVKDAEQLVAHVRRKRGFR